MKNVSIFKKIKLIRFFNKTIKSNQGEILTKFNLRIDRAGRIYTVLNVPEELIGEAYSLKKQDIDRISENYIKAYGEELARYLNSKGLTELYEYYEIKKVDKYSYLLVYGFSLMKSQVYYRNVYYVALPVTILLSILSILLLI